MKWYSFIVYFNNNETYESACNDYTEEWFDDVANYWERHDEYASAHVQFLETDPQAVITCS